MENTCRSCGGILERVGNYNVCKHCGNKWIIDVAEDVHAVDRANAWAALRDCDFERAAELFDNIIYKEPKNHEAYWGRALALSGIIYVTDLNESKKVPTCNNISEESFMINSDVKKAISFAPTEIGDSYKKQAERIEAIRREWFDKASKEKPYDVFICFKDSDKERGIERTNDSYSAHELYNVLTAEGYKVFFSRVSLQDKISEHYEPYIYNALKTAKVMIVYGERAEYFNAVWVKNEWTRFRSRIEKGEKHKNSLVVVYKNISADELPTSLRSRQCLNSAEITFLENLKRHIKKVIEETNQGAHIEKIEIQSGQMSEKATKIANENIKTREIGRGTSARTDVSEKQRLDLVKSYMNAGMWDDAQSLIESILLNNPNSAELLWTKLLIKYRASDSNIFVKNIVTMKLDDSDLNYIEKILNNADKKLASSILDCLYDLRASMKEIDLVPIIKLILQYNYSNREAKLNACFDVAISKKYFNLFKLLIPTLKNDEVDKYIDYHIHYAEHCSNEKEIIECAKAVLTVDKGNIKALKLLFDYSWNFATSKELIDTFENILKYSSSQISEVKWALNKNINTKTQCEFAKQALRYYNGNIADLNETLVSIAYALTENGLFDDAKYFVELSISSGCENPTIYWILCLIKLGAAGDNQISSSDILLKSIPEYTKYLTLVDEQQRQKCFKLSAEQEKAIQERKDAKGKREEQLKREKQEAEWRRAEGQRQEEERIKERNKKIFKKVGVPAIVLLTLVFIIFVAYPLISYLSGNYSPYISMYGITEFTVPDGTKSIDVLAMAGCDSLVSVNIPDSVESIGTNAFKSCPNLESINFGDNSQLKRIEDSAFYGCNATNLYIPYGVIYVGEYAFAGCDNLVSIDIPSSVKYIERRAFEGCDNLTSVTIPNTIERLGNWVFWHCPKLEVIYYNGSEQEWSSFDNRSEADTIYTIIYKKEETSETTEQTHDDGLEFISNGDGSCYISGIGTCNDVNVIIPDVSPTGDIVTSVGDYAFEKCSNIISITIPNSVTKIGYDAFWGCTGLQNINWGNSIEIIDYGAFFNCSSLTTLSIPEGVTSIGGYAFGSCTNLTSITIPSSVTNFTGEYVFNDCTSLKNVIWGNGIQLQNLGYGLFNNCSSLTDFKIPDGITSIGDYAFNKCTNLSTIIIPSSITSIGKMAFGYCSKLATVYYTDTAEKWNDIYIATYNYPLTSTPRIYNYVPEE